MRLESTHVEVDSCLCSIAPSSLVNTLMADIMSVSLSRRWLRIMCVYLISGIGGFLLSGIFDPTKVSVGGSGSLFGLYGVLILEVLQGWKWVKRPCAELIKILVVVIFLLGRLDTTTISCLQSVLCGLHNQLTVTSGVYVVNHFPLPTHTHTYMHTHTHTHTQL